MNKKSNFFHDSPRGSQKKDKKWDNCGWRFCDALEFPLLLTYEKLWPIARPFVVPCLLKPAPCCLPSPIPCGCAKYATPACFPSRMPTHDCLSGSLTIPSRGRQQTLWDASSLILHDEDRDVPTILPCHNDNRQMSLLAPNQEPFA
jgi:hypothetical protein